MTESVQPVPKVDAPKRYAQPVEQLLAASMDQGSALLCRLAKAAVARLAALPPHELAGATRLFSDEELEALAAELAAVRASGDLLARSLLKDHAARVQRTKGRVTESLQPSGLAVPVVLQGTDFSCGRAALQAVLDYHGVAVDNLQLGHALGTDPDDGTQPEALVAYVRGLGLPCEVRDHANLDDLAHAIGHGAPCVCCVQRNGGGHWIVVTGCTGSTVQAMDPIDGARTQDAGSFLRDWHDTAGGVAYTRWALAVGPPAIAEAQQPSRLHALLEASGVPPLQPEAALDFFRHLTPTLGTDPHRLADGRRTAFTLAVATDVELLQKVKEVVGTFLATGEPTSTPKAIRGILDGAGVTPANPQYPEAVFRTNAMDSYNTGLQDELAREAETFPVWKMSNPSDGRSRPSHAARDGNYYPTSMAFAQVRGTDKADVINCRCTPIPVDKWDWEELQAKGAKLAAGTLPPRQVLVTKTPPPAPGSAPLPPPPAPPLPASVAPAPRALPEPVPTDQVAAALGVKWAKKPDGGAKQVLKTFQAPKGSTPEQTRDLAVRMLDAGWVAARASPNGSILAYPLEERPKPAVAYHVVPARHAGSVLAQGLRPASDKVTSGEAVHSAGKVFLNDSLADLHRYIEEVFGEGGAAEGQAYQILQVDLSKTAGAAYKDQMDKRGAFFLHGETIPPSALSVLPSRPA